MSDSRPSAPTACLLIHGFGGTPFEMEPLAPELRKLGCTVELPVLPGHASSIADFRRTFFPDWLGLAEERFLALAENHDCVVPIGFSMGGSIALTLAAKYAHLPQTRGVIGLAPAHTIVRFPPRDKRDFWLLLTPLLRRLRPEIPIRQNPDANAIAPFEGYETPLCLPQLWSLITGVAAMRALLPRLRCPLFLMYDLGDRVCPPENALRIARDADSTDVTLRWLRMRDTKTSHHMLTTHTETRELAAKACARFVRRLMGLRTA